LELYLFDPGQAVQEVLGADAVAESERIDMISFTGSTKIGKHVASLSGMKKLHMELGGKCACIVLADADIELAAKEIVKGAFTYAGQRCDAISRVLVDESIALYEQEIELSWQ